MKVRKLALSAVLTALSIVLNEFVSIPIPPTSSPLLTLTVGMIPIMFIAYYCGIFYSSICAVVADLLGFFLIGASKGYAFNPGFTINALFGGLVFGLIMRYRDKLDGKKGTMIIVILEVAITAITIPLFSYGFVKTDLGSLYENKYYLFIIDGFAILLNLAIILYSILSRKIQSSNAIIISFIIYQYVVSLLLTPTWLIIMAGSSGLRIFYFWITRLISAPLTIIISCFLTKLVLIPVRKAYKSLDNKENS